MKKPSKKRDLSVDFEPRAVGITLLTGYALLLVAHLVMLFFVHALGHHEVLGLVQLFHFDMESNVPTFFSGMLILTVVGLLFITWMNERQNVSGLQLPWLFLAAGFCLMFFDEMFMIHEFVSRLVGRNMETSGAFSFGWVIPYLAIVAVVGLVLSFWFFRLDRWTQTWFAVSGAIYLSGALGSEMVSGIHYSGLAEDREVWRTLSIDLLATVEESLEMLGLSLFIVTLVKRLFRQGHVLSLTVRRTQSPDAAIEAA